MILMPLVKILQLGHQLFPLFRCRGAMKLGQAGYCQNC
jgi:hypothetical protein